MITPMDIRVGVVGVGRFGYYWADRLDEVTAHEVHRQDMSATPTHMNGLTECDVVFYAVPISQLAAAIKATAPYLCSGAIVADVCSVKVHPCNIIRSSLAHRRDLNLFGTHPLFGPQSAPGCCIGQKIVVCPLAEDGAPPAGTVLYDLLNKLGLVTIVTTPDEHDQEMAESQVLTHLIGRAVTVMGVTRTRLSTKTHEQLMDLVDIVCGNSYTLFQDMNVYNPHTTRVRDQFIESLECINKDLLNQMNNEH